MSKQQTVIYTARTAKEAHLLRNLLAELGIQAVVTNDVLEPGAGMNMVGWSTLPRVVVAEEHAPRARQIALEFDRKGASGVSDRREEEPPGPKPDESPTAMMSGEWPKCPQCEARRTTQCPVCETAGTDFAPVDMGFIWVPDAAEPEAVAEAEAAALDEAAADASRTMLICPTCDEPFEPQYPKICEWCGHEFEDGVEMHVSPSSVEPIDARMIAVIAGLLVLAVALGAYFWLILQESGTAKPSSSANDRRTIPRAADLTAAAYVP